jgi:nucleoid-associated protein YgaU
LNESEKSFEARHFIFGALIVIFAIIIAFTFFGQDEQLPSKALSPAESTSQVDHAEKSIEIIDRVIPSFDVVRISRGGTGVIAGRATPRARVELLSDDEVVGHVTADANGEWVLILENPLHSGPAELSIRSILVDNELLISSNVVVLSIPDRADDQFVESEVNGVVAVLTSRDGSGASQVLQKPGAQPFREIGDSLTLDILDYNTDGSAILSGRAVPRANVALYLDNDYLGSTRSTEEGHWSLEGTGAIKSGPHIMRIDQIIGDGDVHLRIEQPFETGLPVNQAMREGKVIVEPGNNLWYIARLVYGEGIHYTLIFQENVDQIRDPDLIYPGQQFNLPNSSLDQNN